MKTIAFVFFASALVVSLAEGAEPELIPLFNGTDLSGWTPCNIAGDTFFVREGMLVTSGRPTGTIRTEKMYENFVIEFDWRHLRPGGNSGLFIWADGVPTTGSAFSRGIEIQVLDPGFDIPGKDQWYTTHGDIFAVNGAKLNVAGRISPNGQRSFPSEERTLPSPQWNHYRVVANDGEIRLHVNGKEVTIANHANPRKGYLMLESEGSECQFKDIRIAELPSTGASPTETARATDGFVPLFNGIDLTGWKTPTDDHGHWKVAGEVIDYDGLSESADDKNLWSEKSFKNFQLIVDWRIKEAPYQNPKVFNLLPDGSEALGPDGKPAPLTQPDSDSGIYLRGDSKYQVNIWCWPVGSGEMYGVRRDAAMPAETRAAATPIIKADHPIGQWNRFEITVIQNRVSVVLNDQTVLPEVTIPGLPVAGPIALQHHGSQRDGQWTSPPSLVQFRNVFIRELP